MVVNLDFILPILTHCLRWHKKDVSNLVIQFGNPSDAHLVSKLWWSSLSNALLKSTSSTRIMVSLVSSAAFHLCTSSISACTVDVPLTDPNCWGSTWSPTMAVIQAQMKCSKHQHQQLHRAVDADAFYEFDTHVFYPVLVKRCQYCIHLALADGIMRGMAWYFVEHMLLNPSFSLFVYKLYGCFITDISVCSWRLPLFCALSCCGYSSF